MVRIIGERQSINKKIIKIQMFRAYNTKYTTNTAIYAPLDWLRLKATIPKIMTAKLPNLPFL